LNEDRGGHDGRRPQPVSATQGLEDLASHRGVHLVDHRLGSILGQLDRLPGVQRRIIVVLFRGGLTLGAFLLLVFETGTLLGRKFGFRLGPSSALEG